MIFFAEMALKIAAFSIRGYFKSSWNCFDFLLVVASTSEMIVEYVTASPAVDASWISAFRALRILRALRVAQNWIALQKLLATMKRSLNAYRSLTLLLLLVVFTFAVVGFHLFSDVYTTSNFPGGASCALVVEQ